MKIIVKLKLNFRERLNSAPPDDISKDGCGRVQSAPSHSKPTAGLNLSVALPCFRTTTTQIVKNCPLLAGDFEEILMTYEHKPRPQPAVSEPLLLDPKPTASAPADVKIAHVYVL